jgi:hypothetical protein
VLSYHHSSDFLPLNHKVEFDGDNRIAFVHPEVIELDIRKDLYSDWVRWRAMPVRGNSVFYNAIRYTGLDAIPGGFTGDTYFMINGWKLHVDLTKVKITGVLFSDDYPTAYYDYSDKPLYPATVSSLVMSSVSYQNVVTGDLSVVPTATQIAVAVRAAMAEIANLDASVSSRLAGVAYTASPASADIAEAVWANPAGAEVAIRLAEAWGRLGLDPSKPLNTGQTSITFGQIVMALTGDTSNTTVTRQ